VFGELSEPFDVAALLRQRRDGGLGRRAGLGGSASSVEQPVAEFVDANRFAHVVVKALSEIFVARTGCRIGGDLGGA
jgi:hypothetical protein